MYRYAWADVFVGKLKKRQMPEDEYSNGRGVLFMKHTCDMKIMAIQSEDNVYKEFSVARKGEEIDCTTVI